MSSIVEGVRSLSATSFMRALTPITGTLFIKLKGGSGSSPLNSTILQISLQQKNGGGSVDINIQTTAGILRRILFVQSKDKQ